MEKQLAIPEPSSLNQEGERNSTIAFIDPVVEKRLKRKLDLMIIPVLTLTYLFK